MKKVLFVLGRYIQHTGQNGNCIRGIIDVWKNQDVCADIVCIESKYDINREFEKNIDVVSYNPQSENRIIWFLKRIVFCPLESIARVNSVKKVIEQRITGNHYDAVIAVVNPPETAQAVMDIKKHYSEINFILYEIDPTSNRYKNPKNLMEKLWNYKSWLWEKKIYSQANTIIHMKTHKTHFSQKKYKPYSDKTMYLDIPNLKVNFLSDSRNDKPLFVYAGAFYPELRNPAFMLKVFVKLKSIMPFTFDIYTRTLINDIQKANEDTNGSIVLKDPIPQELLSLEIEKADFLVSVGNKQSDFLPSKVLEYIGTGKKIIHFYSDPQDVSLDYFSRYPKVLLISELESVDDVIKKIISFGRRDDCAALIDESIILERFVENTIDYSASKIKQLL